MRITSTRNSAVALLRSLERSSARNEHGLFLVEGVRLVAEAAQAGARGSLALYDPDLLRRTDAGAGLLDSLTDWVDQLFEADPRVLRAAAQTETPGGVVVAIRRRDPPPLERSLRAPFGVVLDRLSDPGNAGTIARTADAVGAGYVIATENSVDLFSPKVVRAGMGAHFRLPLYSGVAWSDIAAHVEPGSLVAASGGAETSMYGFDWPETVCLVVGSEAHGLSEEAERYVTQRVKIPMRPGVESLNASVAASILIYHVVGTHLS